MLFEIDHTLDVPEIDLHIAKPNKHIIGHLKEAYGKRYRPKLGNLSELEFSIPYQVEKHHRLIDNPNIDKIKDRYLIRAIYQGVEEWFRIDVLNPSSDENGDTLRVHAFSLGIELRDKIVRLINETSKDAEYMMDLCLGGTGWTRGIVDNELLGRFRAFNISESNNLDFLYSIAETYQGIIVWDTVNRKVHLKAQDNVGLNQGLLISYGKYLKSLGKESNSNEMTTMLIPRGHNNLSIREVSPNGSEYIADFSYFIYPFARDEDRSVLRHSYYMDDDLCHALLDYQELLDSKQGELSSLLNQRNQLFEDLLTKENELVNLEIELAQIQDSIDIELSNGRDASDYQQQEQNKITEIENKEAEINNIQNDLDNNQQLINDLQSQLSMNNNFTTEQLNELHTNYMIEKTWTNDYIIDPQDLYDEALKVFEKMREPQTQFQVDVVNFTQILEGQRDWDKLKLGDTITIHHERLGEYFTAKIIEFEIDFENQSVMLTVANTKDILTDEEKFYKRLTEARETSMTVNLNKWQWNDTVESTSAITAILEGRWESAKREIVGGVNESVTINNRGITIQDSDDPKRFVRMTNSVIGLTEDGGTTFRTAITPSGIVAEEIVGKLLAGERLEIDASNSEGTSIFSVNASGVKILGSSLTIEGKLPKDQMDLGDVVEFDTDYINGIRIDAQDGVVATRSDNKLKTTLNATDGIKISRNTGTSDVPVWQDLFYADTNGNIIVDNVQMRRISIRDSSDNVIIDADTGTIDFRRFPNKYGVLDSGNIPNISASKLTSGTIDANYINVINLNANNISAGSISGDRVSGGTIYGATISGGYISSDTDINVARDVTIGNNLYVGNQSTWSGKSINFNVGAYINYADTGITIYGQDGVNLTSPHRIRIDGDVQFNGNVTGIDVTAKFA